MSFLPDSYKALLYQLLPRGEAWPQEPEDAPVWDALLDALCEEPGRITADVDRMLNAWIDFPDELIPDFERILFLPDARCGQSVPTSLADRRAAITSKLLAQGDPNLENMQAAMATLKSGAVLKHQLHKQFKAGGAVAGDAVKGAQWLATWTLEYMSNILSYAQDAANTGVLPWHTQSGSVTWSNNVELSRYGGSNTADQASMALNAEIRTVITNTANGDLVRYSCWLKGAPATAEIAFVNRAGAVEILVQAPTRIHAHWNKLQFVRAVGSGGSDPYVRLIHKDALPRPYILSWATAGKVDPAVECAAPHSFQIHTTGEFHVLTENGNNA